MEDKQIIELYFARKEQAIQETKDKYNSFCFRIALNILSFQEDAEECVNDTYLAVWNQIPPTMPASFKAFIGRITRNISINHFRKMHARKRYDGMEIMLSELNDCVPSLQNVEQTIEAMELSKHISNWLDTLPEFDCALFVRRYWFGDAVQDLAKVCGISAAKLSQKLFKLRKELKKHLEKEEIIL